MEIAAGDEALDCRYRRVGMPSRLLAPAVVTLFLTACFPTFQNARVGPGFRLDASFTALIDQERDHEPQGGDGILTVSPVYGFRDRVEIGLPIGIYWENGIGRSGYATSTQSQNLVVQPYVKFALLESGSRRHLARSLQAAGVLPGSIGVRYGREQRRWQPHVGLTWIFSGGPAGRE